MASVVLAPDLLIAYLRKSHPQHMDAVSEMRFATEAGTSANLSAANYAHLLLGPSKTGNAGVVRRTVAFLGVKIISVDEEIAELAVRVSAQTGVRLSEAFAIATARRIDALLLSCDEAVTRASRTFDAELELDHEKPAPAGRRSRPRT